MAEMKIATISPTPNEKTPGVTFRGRGLSMSGAICTSSPAAGLSFAGHYPDGFVHPMGGLASIPY